MRRTLLTLLCCLIFSSNLSSSNANDLTGTYQLDFVAINTASGSPVLTETQARNWVTQLNQIYGAATASKIKLEFRTLYPPQTTTDRINSPIGLKAKFPATAVPKSSTAVKSVLIGVISEDSSLGFAGIAVSGGEEMLLNGINGADFLTTDLSYSPTKAGSSKYRIYIKATKQWAAYIDRPFTQRVVS
jgi:hypothetical protein